MQETPVQFLGWEDPLKKTPDTPGSPEGNTEGPGTASSDFTI